MNHTHCTECGWKLRPARKTAKELPNTRPHNSNGVCRPCYMKHYHAERAARRAAEDAITNGIRPADKGISEGFDVNHAKYALDSWLRNLPSKKNRAAA